MSAADVFGLVVSISILHISSWPSFAGNGSSDVPGHRTTDLLRRRPDGLAYPLGIYMARVYEGRLGLVNGRLAAGERWFLRLVGSDPEHEQDWKSTPGRRSCSRLVFTAAVPPPALAGASAAEPRPPAGRLGADRAEHRRELRHQHQLAVLRRRVHDVVPDADGGTGRAELRLGRGRHGCAGRRDPRFRRRTTSGLGNFWRDLYRSLVYILLPLSVILGIMLISQGVPQTFDGHARRPRSRAGAGDRPRAGGIAIAIKQLGTTAAACTTRTRPYPSRTRTGSRTSSRCIAILLIPIAQVSCSGK